ncbi:MAG: iron-containing alcohol dehydrogenase family protein [Spirochaetales bacterium]|nr:iron-containing alcohol dehydrogenase family protein [Spirochaetales bacterium]
MNFQFYMPTRVLSGADCIKNNSARLKELGTKAFIMSGKSSAANNGSLHDMCEALKAEGMEWCHYNEVKPNPSLEDVRSAAEQANKCEADFIVALGGGSAMDAAKAVAVLAAEPVSNEALLGQRTFNKVLPLAVVPTTSGTGSEVTPYSILTNNAMETKSFLNSEQVFPKLAFLDGRYTLELPRDITNATVIDALSHSAEAYLAVRATPPAQALALESLRLIGSVLPSLANPEPLSVEQRDTLLYASMLAGIVIAQSGTTAVHAMGYSLTYFKGLDHGVANGLLMTEYFRFIEKARPEEVGKIREALGFASLDDFGALVETLLGTFTLSKEEVTKFAGIAVKAGNILNTNPQPTEEDLYGMLSNCFLGE